MLALYYADVSAFDEAFLRRADDDLRRLQCPTFPVNGTAFSRKSRAALLSLSGTLIVRWFFNRYGFPHVEIVRAEFGKPYVPNSNIFFNISHSKNLVCAAFSDRVTGIDIEYIRGAKPPLARFFTREEREYIGTRPDLNCAFFYIWTRKEALLKALGCGWRGDASYNTTPEYVSGAGTLWHLQSFALRDNYAAAVCAAESAHGYTLAELSCDDLFRL